jgi:hypothetical protein
VEYPGCEAALQAFKEGKLDCDDFRAVRQVVMCKVWHQPPTPEEPGGFTRAVNQAWDEVQAYCAAAPKPTPVQSWLVKDESGQKVGAVTAYTTGEIDICYKGQCRNEFVVPGLQDNVVAAMEDILPIFGLTLVPERKAEAE